MAPRSLCIVALVVLHAALLLPHQAAADGKTHFKEGGDGKGSSSATLEGHDPHHDDHAHPEGHHEHEGGDTKEGHNLMLHDISVPYKAGLPTWRSDTGLDSSFKTVVADMAKGSFFYGSSITMGVHTGTHVDAPSHFLKEEWDAGNNIEKLDLDVLIGPALVVEVPHDTNITAALLEGLNLHQDVERVLFKTGNTHRNLLKQSKFASDYVGMTADGARYMVEHTNIKLAGIDYLSIATMDDLAEAHQILLRKGIIPVETLDLSALEAGRWYHLTCLPLKIEGAEGSPARCVVYGPDNGYEEERHHMQHGNEQDGGFIDDGEWNMVGYDEETLRTEDDGEL